MRTFQVICLAFCLLGIISAVTGISAIEASTEKPLTITKTDVSGRVFSIVIACAFATFAYGIHKRIKMTWLIGGVIFIIIAIEFIFEVSFATLRLPGNDRWIAFAGSLLGYTFLFWHWGLWWFRQRSYFYPEE